MSGRATKWIVFVVLPLLLALYVSYPPVGVVVKRYVAEVHTAATAEEAARHRVAEGEEYEVVREVKERSFLPLAMGKRDVERRFLERLEDGTVLYEVSQTVPGRVKLGLDVAGGTELLYQLRQAEGQALGGSQAATIDILKKRIDPSNVKEYRIQPLENSRILIQVPQATASEVAQLKNRLQRMGRLEFRVAVPRPDDGDVTEPRFLQYYEEAQAGNVPDEFVKMHVDGDPAARYYLVRKGDPAITGQYLDPGAVRPTTEQYRPAIAFQFNALGMRRFAGITERNQGWSLAIVLDGVLRSAPRIRERIYGPGVISGNFTQQEVADIVNVLQAGSLPMDIDLLQENTVGPQLGRDSIRKGLRSLAVAGLLVLAFVGVYYLRCGLVADAALVLNLVFLVGVLSFLGAALTLPGMAGILLTVGMAVDANVLIFERIREESGAGKGVRMALRNGYERAFTTIVDSNVTTLLTGLILYLIGTGPVRGFAVTLSFGILLSMFTAVVLTRLAFETFVEREWLTAFKMRSWIGTPTIDFARLRRPALIASAVLLFVGMAAFFTRGAELYDIDFTGGSLVQISLARPTPVSEVRALLADGGFPRAEVQAVRTEDSTAEGATAFGIRIKGAGIETDELLAELRQKLQAAGLPPADDGLKITGDGRAVLLTAPRALTEMELRQALGEGGDPYALADIGAITPAESAPTRHVTVRAPIGSAAARQPGLPGRILRTLAWAGLERAQLAIIETGPPAGDGPAATMPFVLDGAVQSEVLVLELERRQFGGIAVEREGDEGGRFRLVGARKRLEDLRRELPVGATLSIPLAEVHPDGVTARLAVEMDEQDVRARLEQQALGDLLVISLDARSPSYRMAIDVGQVREQMEAIFAHLAPSPSAVTFAPVEGAASEGHVLVRMKLGQPMAFEDVRSQMEDSGLMSRGEIIVGATDYAPGVVVSDLTLRLPAGEAEALQASLQDALGRPQAVQQVVRIGATVAQEMQGKALLAVVFASVIIVLYVAVRFHAFRFGLAAVVALLHDVVATAGLVALADWVGGFGDVKINLAMLAAFLTILGYSINDTIVVFDRIRENMGSLGRKAVDGDLINLSINQTLSRTVLTSVTTLIVVLILYVMGGSVLQGVALTLTIGVVIGTYSSVFIASPILLDWPRLFAVEPRVPGVARFYGVLMMLGGPLAAFVGGVGAVVHLLKGSPASAGLYLLIWLVPGVLACLVGRGLRRGRGGAVGGLIALAAVALVQLGAMAGLHWYGLGLGSGSDVTLLLALWALACLPPVVSALRHRDVFRTAA
ncbi:MAG: protein translocase subunit SecD [Candidatus Brocadiaceae bacterium]|nr:protein translocase subunit SecD [Candidatus Brocadiaceae bacterium]